MAQTTRRKPGPWAQLALDGWLAGIEPNRVADMACGDIVPQEVQKGICDLYAVCDEMLELEMRFWLSRNPRPIGQ